MRAALAGCFPRLVSSAPADLESAATTNRRGPTLLEARNVDAAGPAPVRPGANRQVDDPLAGFLLPADQVQRLVHMQQQSRKALDPDFAMALPPLDRAALDAFYATRTRLLSRMLPAATGVNPDMGYPAFVTDLAGCRAKDALKRALGSNAGLIIGESHACSGSKQLLGTHMKDLSRWGVDTLYLEHLQADVHQDDLDHLWRSGVTTPALQRFLREQDQGHMTEAGDGTFTRLVQSAAKAGVRIVALDLLVSYHLRGTGDERPLDGTTTSIRTKLFNEVAFLRIQHHQRHAPQANGRGRWVSLMGNAHAGHCNGIVGVAARLGAPSMRVEDCHARDGIEPRAGADPGRMLRGGLGDPDTYVQSDYLLRFPQSSRPRTATTTEPCSAEESERIRQLRATIATCARDLSRIGTYRIMRRPDGGHVLVHRSSTRGLVAQRIVTAAEGGVQLQLDEGGTPANWSHVDKPFPDLARLRQALSQHMEEVPPPEHA